MNLTVLIGRLTRDPEVRYSTDNMAVARFTLAVDRFGKDKGADFISCVAFGKQGEFVEKYLKQGTKIALRGRIQTGSYTNRDGQKVYTTDVVAEIIEFAENSIITARKKDEPRDLTPADEPKDEFRDLTPADETELPFN